MYLAYCVLFVAAFLICENRVIGGVGLAIIGMLVTLLRVREERLLIKRFGDCYRKYREKAGAFIPRLGR